MPCRSTGAGKGGFVTQRRRPHTDSATPPQCLNSALMGSESPNPSPGIQCTTSCSYERIHFSLNSGIPEAAAELDRVVRDISETCEAGIAIQVEGYADSLGSPQLNQRLSENRAREVALYLKGVLGLSGRDIEWVGRGVGGDDPSFRKTLIRVIQRWVY